LYVPLNSGADVVEVEVESATDDEFGDFAGPPPHATARVASVTPAEMSRPAESLRLRVMISPSRHTGWWETSDYVANMHVVLPGRVHLVISRYPVEKLAPNTDSSVTLAPSRDHDFDVDVDPNRNSTTSPSAIT
jgi:hypothetical protein